jgi:hypothetical protein
MHDLVDDRSSGVGVGARAGLTMSNGNVIVTSMREHPLRLPLLANALFSAVTGLILALVPAALGELLGPKASTLYVVLGVGLLAFSGGLVWLASRPRPAWVVAVLLADLGWVVGTMAVVGFTWSAWKTAGVVAVATTNAVVMLLVFAQARGILRVFAVPGEPNRYEVCVRVDTPVESRRLWPIVADLGTISEYMADLVSSELEGDAPAGVGAVRTCENRRGQRWSERCVRWREGDSFDVRFLTEDPAFPYPFSDMIGGWRLVPKEAGCAVEVWWHVVPRQRWLAPFLLPLMRQGAARSFEAVVASMVARAEGRAPETARPRLQVAFC